jgi:outer membrane protein OmpA-like peptidoglycan-associated protein
VLLQKIFHRFFYCIVLMQCSIGGAHAQNLFANPGFEAINNCVEYKADCAPEAWFNIPAGNFLVNSRIAPRPYIGDMVLVVPVGNVMANFNKPRYVYTGLCCPLEAGKKYVLSFYINTAGFVFHELALYFTESEPALNTVGALPETPSFSITKKNLGERRRDNWMTVQLEYTATGSERFFLFTTKGVTQPEFNMSNAMNKSGDVLYFIDEIDLHATDSVPPCATYSATIDKLFAYNFRHSNNVTVFEKPEPVKPVVQFVNDTITIPGLLFDVNKSDIKAPVAKILDSVAAALQQQLFLQINITGHTDSTGKEKENQLLSESRAAAIKNYLAEKLPAKADKMTAAGKAALQPVAGNTTAAGRQRNRRVEIIITYIKSVQ